jgi:hypothetical protein
LRFLKSTSVSWTGVAEGGGVVGDESAFGEDEVVGDVPAIGLLADGVCSCAVKIEIDEIQVNNRHKKPDRVVVIGCRL